MRAALAIAATVALAVLAVGCGEKTAVTVYKQGQYQGKPDKLPWDNNQFKGDKVAWEKAIKARNLNQSESFRASGGWVDR